MERMLTDKELTDLLAKDLSVKIEEIKRYIFVCEACEAELTYAVSIDAIKAEVRIHKQLRDHRKALARKGLKSPLDE